MPEQFKIKPCPFCSYTEPAIQITEKKICIMCTVCKSRGPEFEFGNIFADNFSHQETEDLAFERWNYRPTIGMEDEEKDVGYVNQIGNEINKAIETYMKNTLFVDEPTNIKKFQVACDLLSFLNKKPPIE